MSSPSRTSSCSCPRSTTGSPPPDALMKFAPRRKSSASVSVWIHPMLALLSSPDLVGQLVPALALADPRPQPEAPGLRRVVERRPQAPRLPGHVRPERLQPLQRPGQRPPQPPVVPRQALDVVEVDVVAV